jgi:tetratricopeptide (TPR) repeat protein
MTFAIGIGTLLATFSKENGALLPLLILVIECCMPKQGKPAWQWRALCLWLPSIALVLLLARYVDFSENPWPNRNFNMIERLLTEARIVSEYLFHLFVPRIEGNGLYQDGYVISKGLFQPVTTVLAIGFLSVLTALAIMLRKSFPVITLAILFFMAAHLMESTVIGLELYFEHRNYLAALFLFLPIAYYSVKMSQRYRTIPLIMACLLILLASMTYLRATLWSDNDQLELYWVQSATDSPRAINSLAAMYMRNNEYEKANALLQEQGERLSHSSLLTARLLLQKVHVGVATEKDFIEAADRLQYQEFDAQTVKGVRTIVESVIDGNNFDYAIYTLKLLDTMNQSSVYNQFPLFVRLQYYLRGQLYRYLEKSKQMLENYSEAIQHYNETDAALAMVAEVASAGYYTEALKLLDQSEQVLAEQSDRSLKRSRVTYEADINNLRQLFNNALEQEASVHED